MRPLQKCRNARNLSLPALEKLLSGIKGGSKTTLSRLETKPVNNVSKSLLIALSEIFKLEGLKTEHIISPELYSDFIVNYSGIEEKKLCHTSDKKFNEQEILLNITKQWIEKTPATVSKFAAELYEKLSDDNLVITPPVTADEFTKWQNTALKRITRILDEEMPLPLSWKYYWLSCLPENIKQTALNQMLANSGYMLIALPITQKINVKDETAKIDVISRQFADVIGKSKPAMDGVYDDRDDATEVQLLQDKLMALVAACLREQTVIYNSTGITSKFEQIWANSPLNR